MTFTSVSILPNADWQGRTLIGARVEFTASNDRVAAVVRAIEQGLPPGDCARAATRRRRSGPGSGRDRRQPRRLRIDSMVRPLTNLVSGLGLAVLLAVSVVCLQDVGFAMLSPIAAPEPGSRLGRPARPRPIRRRCPCRSSRARCSPSRFSRSHGCRRSRAHLQPKRRSLHPPPLRRLRLRRRITCWPVS